MIAALASWLSLTRVIGMVAFGSAAVASGATWASLSRQHSAGRLPMILTLIQSFLFLDIVFTIRWQLHDALEDAAIRARVYEGRELSQQAMLLALGLGLAVVCMALVRSQRTHKGATLACLGTALGVASWCMEVISLHTLDVVLYETNWPFMPVALVWIVVGLMTTVGVSLYARAAHVATV